MDDQRVLEAIEKTGERTERAIVTLSDEIRTLAAGLTEGFAKLRSAAVIAPQQRNGQAWAIATFTSVILALGTLGFFAIDGVDDKVDLVATHQKELSELRANNLERREDALDEKLQLEIKAVRDFLSAKFEEADAGSEQRHLDQQKEIERILNWFEAPWLRNSE